MEQGKQQEGGEGGGAEEQEVAGNLLQAHTHLKLLSEQGTCWVEEELGSKMLVQGRGQGELGRGEGEGETGSASV